MDGNKDAAQHCVSVGNRALKEGDKIRAHKFLSKALRLDPTLPLESLVTSLGAEIQDQSSESPPQDKPAREDSQEANGSHVRSSECNEDSAARNTQEYTAEQVEIVRRIRRTKDYYAILGLEKGCSADEIRKAYRKVSLKVHPDKNKSPGADEAFKSVSKAFACLNEPELRQRYDQYGPEEAQEVAQQQAFRQRRRNGFVHEDMFDPDEIFNAFFNGTPYATNGFHRGHFVRTFRTGGQHGGARVHTREVHFGGLMSLLQLLPVLLLIFLSYIPFSKPVYSLEQSAPYEVKYLTSARSVPFFVRSHQFDNDYPIGSHARKNIELQVERDYAEVLKQNCHRELGWKQWNHNVKTPNCDLLRAFYAS